MVSWVTFQFPPVMKSPAQKAQAIGRPSETAGLPISLEQSTTLYAFTIKLLKTVDLSRLSIGNILSS